MLLKNLANLSLSAANLTLVKPSQMECSNKMVNLINGNITLISQRSINVLTKILEPRNQALNRKCIWHGKFNFYNPRHANVA